MSVQVQVRDQRGATVAALHGAADASLLERLAGPLRCSSPGGGLLVLDLDHFTLAEPKGLRALIEALGAGSGRAPLCLVVGRARGVALLTRWRIHDLVPVHRSVDDAISAHRVDQVAARTVPR